MGCGGGGEAGPWRKSQVVLSAARPRMNGLVVVLLQLRGQEYRPNITRDKFYRSQKCRIVNKICYFNIILNKKFKSGAEQAQNTKYMISALTDIFWALLKFCDFL